ncbi:hypothetical protein SAMN05428642_10291 [Flaviramulus basaltis]|uniref:Uncharacterized protein n=1 Tax=Flaviramulus basaltis TaxID=369401 RepID=A0A1K2IGD5_9FLAO|nr:hypothetical protein [Flaviramulus basaltis]SFZ91481.1 hypothetical protein SAMN05428642_10291 [Flaviramulus basaltis]
MSKLLILVLLTIAFVSCDGRDRKYKSNVQVLQETNLLSSFKEKVEFIPKQHIQIVTDTILNNGFEIKIKYNSVENNSIVKTIKTKNDTVTQVHYKNFEAKLQVIRNGEIINESIIDKNLFNQFETNLFWENSIMQYVWIDYNASTESEIYLNTSFNIPETETYKDFIIKIDKYGSIQIKEKTISANII